MEFQNENIDFEVFLEELLDRPVFRQYGCELKCSCPYHDERTPSFYFNTDKALFQCFGCGEKGDMVSLVMHARSCDFKSAIEYIEKKTGVQGEGSQSPAGGGAVDLQRMNTIFIKSLKKASHARRFLEARGFDADMVSEYSIGYCPKSIEMNVSGRITFPIYKISNGRKVIVGFSGRAIDNSTKRWVHTPGVKTADCFYTPAGLDAERNVVIVEGPFDALAIAVNGKTNVLAIFGSSLSDRQASVIARDFKNVTIFPDYDRAGELGALRSAASLAGKVERVYIIPSRNGVDGSDPCSTVMAEGLSAAAQRRVLFFAGEGDFINMLERKNYAYS